MTHQEFMRSDASRRRYWARSYVGWLRFSGARCNAGHVALADLERAGVVRNVITQNVDRLHQQAGSCRVLELHGTTHEVVCMQCGGITPRVDLQSDLTALNPSFAALAEADVRGRAPGSDKDFGLKAPVGQPALQRPDGDAELEGGYESFIVPPCAGCGGVLKPNVVFFGDNLPKERTEYAQELAEGADAVLAVGTSLMTLSSFRVRASPAPTPTGGCRASCGDFTHDALLLPGKGHPHSWQLEVDRTRV